MSLMVYGYVADTKNPLIPATDLPTYKPDDPYAHTATGDDEYSMCGCGWVRVGLWVNGCVLYIGVVQPCPSWCCFGLKMI